MWGSITGLLAEIEKCEEAGATCAAIAMAYVCIDTMAFLSMPETKSTQTRGDFIDWVNRYLEGHEDQPYRYAGVDVYAARCALLHAFGSEAQAHRSDTSVKLFGYHNGGRHSFDPEISPNLVILGTASFLNDVRHAVDSFIRGCETDAGLRAKVEARLPKVIQMFPFPRPYGSSAEGELPMSDEEDEQN